MIITCNLESTDYITINHTPAMYLSCTCQPCTCPYLPCNYQSHTCYVPAMYLSVNVPAAFLPCNCQSDTCHALVIHVPATHLLSTCQPSTYRIHVIHMPATRHLWSNTCGVPVIHLPIMHKCLSHISSSAMQKPVIPLQHVYHMSVTIATL